ncbi:hypothetical protein WI41_11820 [Burkholderia latens]|uniref:Uncharacterized protein n=1 Tax=Burkholderia latens TaxID=488446 RepID=A0AAP1C5R0_9BURK|nr:hypothetical protein WI41_11820 [Burkholderia latens]
MRRIASHVFAFVGGARGSRRTSVAIAASALSWQVRVAFATHCVRVARMPGTAVSIRYARRLARAATWRRTTSRCTTAPRRVACVRSLDA